MSRVAFFSSRPTANASFRFGTFAVLSTVLVAVMISPPHSRGQDAASDEEDSAAQEYSEDEQRQIDLAERFLTILAQNPRRGTALDRVYGHHIEFGTLETFIETLEASVKKEPENGQQWMLLGLFQSQRGNDNGAAEAFAKAEKLRAEDPIASYYLGQSLLRIGEPREAVEAMQRAIDRNPNRTDTLEIFQQLGRIHQRAQRTEEALAVWKRLEEMFPGDPRVLEQIAVTLAEEGQPASALKRYLQLAEITRDDYRRTMYRIEAAELKVKTSDLDGGIADFEMLLGDLNPEGWLFRDVRRRIENVFLRSSDQDALVAYYEKWLEENPEDVEAMARMARFLASAARMPESREWMEKALRLAPSRADLRKAYIDQLVDDQQFSEALKQYQKLSEADPGNADVLRDWGKLVLRDRTQDMEDRRAEAARVWRKMLANRADHALTHALTHAQVADLFRAAEMNDQALEMYEKAVELAPNDPQYREFLGEFHHIQKRNEEALETWAAIAAPPNRTADNLSRLAEVYHSFGYLDQALAEVTAATEMDAKDFALQIRAANYHNQAEKYDEALSFIAAAEGLADDSEKLDTVIRERIEVYQSSQQLEKRIEELVASIQANNKPTWEQWHLLARYHEAARAWPEATDAIDTALKVAPANIVALTTAARIAEAAGELSAAADLSRQLAEVDRRYRADHWMNVARLEIQLGRADEAIAAAEELIRSAPGNTEHYEFFAQTCFRLGRSEEGLDALRKAVRINPNEPALIMSLGSALANQLKTREAIELYWRAFEKTEDLDDLTTLTTKLVPLYEQVNQLDQLLERLDRLRGEEDQRREMTICLAQAHQTSGNTIAAQQELESLLSENTRDTNLLQQLAKLCETSGDQEAAIAYRRQLVTLAPGHETEFPLAKLLQENGQHEAASDIFVRLTQREEDPIRLLRSLDSLLAQGSFEAVLRITEPLLSQQRDDWEMLYREGVAYASMERFQEAELRFQRILDLRLPLETMGAAAKSRYDQQQRKAKSDNLRGLASRRPSTMTPLQMLSNSNSIRQATGLSNDQNQALGMQSRSLPTVWSPDVLGTARMAAWGWRLRFERDATASDSPEAEAEDQPDEQPQSIGQRLVAEAVQPQATSQAIMDGLFVSHLTEDNEAIVKVARRMAQEGGKEEKSYFLSTLARRIPANQNQRGGVNREPPTGVEPLSEDDIEFMLQCVADLDQQEEDQPPIPAGQIAYASNGQAYILIGGSYQPLYGVFRGGSMFLSPVMAELRLAGRAEEAEEMLQAELDRAKKSNELAQAISMVFREGDQTEIPIYFDRWKEAMLAEIEEMPLEKLTTGQNQNQQRTRQAQLASITQPAMQWMGVLGEAEENQKIATILDSLLDVNAALEKKLQSAPAPPSSPISASSAPARQLGISIYYGTSSSYSRYTVPLGDPYISTVAVHWLRQVYEVYQRNDVMDDLTELLRARIEQADEATRGQEQLLLATLFDWMGQREDMIELVSAAAPQYAADLAFRFHLIELYESVGEFDVALEMIDATEVRDQKILQRRELIAIGLAERLGDIDRARAAAERLFGLRLDSQTQLSLVERMRRLGMHSMADAVLARTERSAGNDPPALASLMMLYQGQGKVDHANQLARLILLRTTSPLTMMATSNRNPRNVSSATDAYRRQALQVLRQGGGLTDLIEQLERRIEKTSGTPRMYELLVEYYEADGKNKEVVEVLNKAIELNPAASGLRLKMGQLLEKEGKHDEACTQYLAVLSERPDWILENIYQYRTPFTTAGRMRDLADAVSKLDIRSIRQPYYLIELANNLLREKEDIDVAVSLLEKVEKNFPQYRQNLLSSVDQNALQHDGFLKFVMKTMLPNAETIKTNPWAGVDSVRSYDNNGGVNSHFDFLLEGIRKTSEQSRQEVEKSIAATAEENPNWLGGQVILAKMEMDDSRPKEAEERLAKVFTDSDAVAAMPSNASWIVGTMCEKFDGLKPQGRELFEQAVRTDTSNSNQLNYSPIKRLVQIYKTQGENEAAKQLLLKSLNGVANQYDSNYQAYLQFQNVGWVAEQLLELGFPGEALRLQQSMLSNKDLADRASQVGGNSAQQYQEQLKTGIRSAITALASGDNPLRVEDFLAVSEDLQPGQPALELMLQFPRGEELATTTISSSMGDLFALLAEKPEIAASLERHLLKLSEQYPDEVSIATLRVMAQPDPRDEAVVGNLRNLVQRLEETPWESIPEGRRPNARQRREAALSIPLWLVAQRLLGTEDWETVGRPLAERALEGARRQLEDHAAIAILYHWGQLDMEQGDSEAAEDRWHEALALATRRPGQSGRLRSSSDANDADAEDEKLRQARTIAPLTVSQFSIAMILAKAGADHELPELSRRAAFESLSGGTPQPDPPSGSNSSGGRVVQRTVVTSFLSTSSGVSSNPLESKVAQEVQAVVGKWDPESYSPISTYELLRDLVLPPHRAGEVLLYPNQSQLSQGETTSLAPLLIRWAGHADQLPQLAEAVAERAKLPQTRIPAGVLQTLIAIAQRQDDQSTKYLEELTTAVTQLQGSLPLAELACHAAIPAFEHKALRAAAYPILSVAVEARARPTDQNQQLDADDKLAQMVNGYRIEQGNSEEVTAYFDRLLTGRQAYYARYGSQEYGLYLQLRDLVSIANQAGKIGAGDIALDYLGRTVDFKAPPQYSRPSVGFGLALAVDHVRGLPPAERYQVWSQWTLPTENRQSLRFVAERMEPVLPPEAYRSWKLDLEPLAGSGMLSNFSELVEAARQANQLEELIDQAKSAVESKLPEAESLLTLALVATGDKEKAIEPTRQHFATLVQRYKARDEGVRRPVTPDMLVYFACIEQGLYFGDTPDHFAKLVADLRQTSSPNNHFPEIRAAYASLLADRYNAASRPIDDPHYTQWPRFKHWTDTTLENPESRRLQAFWVPRENQATHLLGDGSGLLMLRYPLTGDFEITFDCYHGTWGEGYAGFGGVIVESQGHGSTTVIRPLAHHETLQRSGNWTTEQPGESHIRIRSVGGKWQYHQNGFLLYEEEGGSTSPWLTLASLGFRHSNFRNFKISGEPRTPREVPLFEGNRMDGWNARYYGHSQPRHRLMAEKPVGQNTQVAQQQASEPKRFDWQTEEGILTSHADYPNPNHEGFLFYQRPLESGETFRYEFYYEPGIAKVSPSLGRVAMQLEPDGVETHWMSSTAVNQTRYFEPRYSITEPQFQRSQELPLLPEQWNSIQLSIEEGQVLLRLNNELIYERPAADFADTRFGLFHYRDEKVQVRNAVLAGDWPEDAKAIFDEDLFTAERPLTPGENYVVEALLPRELHTPEVAGVIQAARAMEDAAAYDYLADWVLPNDHHQRTRVVLSYVPLADQEGEPGLDVAIRRILCPTDELVQVASRLGRLDDLRTKVQEIEPVDSVDARHRQTLMALVEIAAGETEKGTQTLRQILAAIQDGLPPYLSLSDRTAELVVALRAGEVPELWQLGHGVAQHLRALERGDGDKRSNNEKWHTMISAAHSAIESRYMDLETDREPLTQWATVPYLGQSIRMQGFRPSSWLYERGTLTHLPSDAWNQLFFQSPLRGKFEILARASTVNHKEVSISIGRHSAEPKHDLSKTQVFTMMHGSRDVGSALKLPVWDQSADFRIVVEGTKVTTFTNGVKIHEETFEAPLDPWLVLQARTPKFMSTIRDLRIIGTPEIPAEIDLIRMAGWSAWRSDVYGHWSSQDATSDAPYVRQDDEIVGNLRKIGDSKNLESLFMYSRPLLEDGEITFETYYEPGKFEIYPALGGIAYLLEADGVAKHRMTEARWETSGRDHGNREPVSDTAPPWKQQDWNQVRLVLRDDQLSIEVNGTKVHEAEVTEPASERFFGLFRYTEQTRCRVRNMVYRGDWPKELPAVEDQQLAYPAGGPYPLPKDQVAQETTVPLGRPLAELEADGLKAVGPADHMTVVGNRLRVYVHKAEPDPKDWPGLELFRQIEGDVEITLDYHNLKFQKAESGWGTTLDLSIGLDDPSDSQVVLGIGQNSDLKPKSIAMLRRNLSGDGGITVDQELISEIAETGRMRLVRREGRVHCLISSGSDQPFRLLHSVTVGDAPISSIRIRAKASEETGELTAELGQLIIREAK
ncbi:MAG: DUF1583 domain-containing protein [Pirellulaceae bacterium]